LKVLHNYCIPFFKSLKFCLQ